MLRLHDMRCAIALLEADLDGAIDGIEIHRQLVSKFRSVPVFEEQFPILAARVMLAAQADPATPTSGSVRPSA